MTNVNMSSHEGAAAENLVIWWVQNIIKKSYSLTQSAHPDIYRKSQVPKPLQGAFAEVLADTNASIFLYTCMIWLNRGQ